MTIILDLPRSLTEFELRFGSEDACAEYLAAVRWPDGFVCPGCGGRKAWQLESKPWTYECAGCGRQTSVTAGTIMHHSRLPLTTWFWAAYVMATQPSGISGVMVQPVQRQQKDRERKNAEARLDEFHRPNTNPLLPDA